MYVNNRTQTYIIVGLVATIRKRYTGVHQVESSLIVSRNYASYAYDSMGLNDE